MLADKRYLVPFAISLVILVVFGVAIPELGIALLVMAAICGVIMVPMVYFFNRD